MKFYIDIFKDISKLLILNEHSNLSKKIDKKWDWWILFVWIERNHILFISANDTVWSYGVWAWRNFKSLILIMLTQSVFKSLP